MLNGLTKPQLEYYESMAGKFDSTLMDNPAFHKAVIEYAIMCDEADQLQKFVNEHGYTYETTSREGTVLTRSYPQHASLTRLRSQMTAILRTLLKYTVTDSEVDSDEKLIR